MKEGEANMEDYAVLKDKIAKRKMKKMSESKERATSKRYDKSPKHGKNEEPDEDTSGEECEE
jgi:hypothetical protein